MMKKIAFFLLAAIAVTALVFTGCKTDPDPGPAGPSGPVKVTITYALDSTATAAGVTAPAAKTVDKGYPLTAEDLPTLTPTDPDYKWDDWYIGTSANKATVGYKVDANTTLTAKCTYEPPSDTDWRVTFDLGGVAAGTAPAPVDVTKGSALGTEKFPPAFTPAAGYAETDGWRIEGWYNGATKWAAATNVTGNITLTAKWEIKITVDYDEKTPPTVEEIWIFKGGSLGAQFPTPKEHTSGEWIFDFWFDETDEDVEVDADTVFDKPVTLKPAWEAPDPLCVIEFELGYTGAPTDPASIEVDRGETMDNQYPEDPERTGFRFDGWYEKSTPQTYTVKYEADTAITKSLTLVAKWLFPITLSKAAYTATVPDWATFTDGDLAGDTEIWATVGAAIGTLPDAGVMSFENTVTGQTVTSSWFTAATGGTNVTEETIVTAAMTNLYARLDAVGGIPQDVAAGSLPAHITKLRVFEDPLMALVASGQATSTLYPDGSVRLASTGTGTTAGGSGISFTYPADIGDFDFVAVEYEIVDKEMGAGTNTNPDMTEIDSQQLGAAGGYNGSVSLAGVEMQGGTRYLDLGQGDTLTYAVHEAEGTGFHMRLNAYSWNTAGRPQHWTIKITKISLITYEHFTLTFDLDYTDDPMPVPLENVSVIYNRPLSFKEPLPIPADRTTDGAGFFGWVDKADDTPVLPSTPALKNYNLKATWRLVPTLPPLKLDFSDTDMVTLEPVASLGTTCEIIASTDDAVGFRYKTTVGTNTQVYQNAWVRMTVQLPDGALLSDYASVDFTWGRGTGDVAWKNMSLLAGTPLPASFDSEATNGPYRISTDAIATNNNGVGPFNNSYTIDTGKALALTPVDGKIEFSFYFHANACELEFWNIVFNPVNPE